MVLGGIKKDNYKELARRMQELGWSNRTNDMCRHEVITSNLFLINFGVHQYINIFIYKSHMKKSLQILLLQERYDKMVAHSKKTGGCYLHEPLRYELNDTFFCYGKHST